MSAILGRIELDQRPVSRTEFARAAATIDEYGPDASGAMTGVGVAFASRHLSVDIQRPKDGNPCTSGPITIVADAILDDRPGLAHAIALDQTSARSMSDAELILCAWLKWGPDCISRIIGDFAFAVWDAEKRQCFLVRDHIGARPLYWCNNTGSIVFASDIRAIRSFTDMASQIDTAIVAEYATNPDRPLSKTFLEDTYFVEPGHYVRINSSGAKIIRWWSRADLKPLSFRSRKDLVEEFQHLTREAVACRLPTGYPVGSHLSAGIDSTSVSALASQALSDRGNTLAACYTWAPQVSAIHPNRGSRDERSTLISFCRKNNTQLKYGSQSPGLDKFFSLKRNMIFEGPTDLSEQLLTLRQGKRDGIRVLLSGWGGDEAYSSHGAGFLPWLLLRGKLHRAVRVIKPRNQKANWRTLWANGVLPLLPSYLYEKLSSHIDLSPNNCFARSELIRAKKGYSGLHPIEIRATANPTDFIWRILNFGHIASRMDTWNAWGAECGIIHRYPLTDRRLLEFVLGLHPIDHFGSSMGRNLPISAFRDILPDQLSKHDLANEGARTKMRADCLEYIRHDSSIKDLAMSNRWVDGRQFCTALSKKQDDHDLRALAHYSEIFSATRLFFLS